MEISRIFRKFAADLGTHIFACFLSAFFALISGIDAGVCRVLGQPRKKQEFMSRKTFSITFLALGVICAVSLVISNILAVKQFDIHIFGLTLPSTAGLLIFPISYIINDCISEVWGYRNARIIIWLAFAANLLAVVMFRLSVALPPSPHWAEMQDSYASVLGLTPRIALASMGAFLLGSFSNALIMSKMKLYHKGRYFWLRAAASTVVGELLDTTFFTVMSFAGVIPNDVIIKIVITETVFKTGYEFVILPITSLVVRYIKRVENTDIYDNNISYNPFSVK